MKGKTHWAFVPLAVFLVGLVLACSNNSSPSASPTTSAELNDSSLERSEASGSVTFAIMPDVSPADGMESIGFEVSMDTHSVNLDGFDLMQLASLRDGLGRTFQPVMWNAPSGGHHRSGILTFTAQPLVQTDSRYLELVIRDVAGTKERVFRWDVAR